jgi:hypothetical protein
MAVCPKYEDICDLAADEFWNRVGSACRRFGGNQMHSQGVLALLKYNSAQSKLKSIDEKCPESFLSVTGLIFERMRANILQA